MSRWKAKKMVIPLTVFTALGVMLSACQGSSSKDAGDATPATAASGTSSTDKPAAKSDKHLDISIAYPGMGTDIKYDPNDKLVQELEKKFNVTFKFVTESWSDYDQQATLWASSDQLPDVFFADHTGDTIFQQWVDQGVVKALPDDLGPYPNLKKISEREDVKAYKYQNKLYFWPMSLSQSNVLPGDRGLFVRKDWMDKLGLQQPKTWDEFINLVTKLTKENPDGNKNVVGITGNNTGFISDMLLSEFPFAGWWYNQDGKNVPGWTSPKYEALLEKEHQLYASGLLDKDSFNGNNPHDSKFVNGQAALVIEQPKNVMGKLVTPWKQAHPDKKFTDYVTLIQMPPGPDGQRYSFQYMDWWAGEFINAKVDDDKMQRILTMFEYLASPEGRKLTNFGFEGTDYKIVDGKIQSLHQQDWNISKDYPSQGAFAMWSVWALGPMNGSEFNTVDPVTPGWDPEVFKMVQDYYDWYVKNTKPANINWSLNAWVTTLPAINAGSTDWVSQAVSGNTKQVWQNQVDTWMKAGGSKQIDDATAKFK